MAVSTYPEWLFEVDRQFRIRTNRSYDDLHIESELLRDSFEREISPPAFVTGYIRYNGLTDFSKFSSY